MPVTYPAREYPSATPLLTIERGGYKRYVKGHLVLWYYKLPDQDKVIEVDDYLVPTVDHKPVITLQGWTLDKADDGRMVWTRGK